MIVSARLVIEYNADSFPVTAKCTICGEEMPQSDQRITLIGKNIKWFTEQFTIHMAQKHPTVDSIG